MAKTKRRFWLKTVDQRFIDKVKAIYSRYGYNLAKYIVFCETMLSHGWIVKLYESKSTVSKYIHIYKGDKKFKIRFSNHRANYQKEVNGDCDFYVGVGHNGIVTTEELIKKLIEE